MHYNIKVNPKLKIIIKKFSIKKHLSKRQVIKTFLILLYDVTNFNENLNHIYH